MWHLLVYEIKAEFFVVKMWRLLVYEIEAKKYGVDQMMMSYASKLFYHNTTNLACIKLTVDRMQDTHIFPIEN